MKVPILEPPENTGPAVWFPSGFEVIIGVIDGLGVGVGDPDRDGVGVRFDVGDTEGTGVGDGESVLDGDPVGTVDGVVVFSVISGASGKGKFLSVVSSVAGSSVSTGKRMDSLSEADSVSVDVSSELP